MLSYLILGFVGGLIRACQGSYKDAPWEGFSRTSFLRSVVSGTVGGSFWYLVSGYLEIDLPYVLIIPLVIFFDSAFTEMYKRGIRVEDLSKYKMPTIFHLNGRVIKDRRARLALAITLWAGIPLLYLFYENVGKGLITNYSLMVTGVVVGVMGGLMVATGGALLDTAWEGFYPLKFFRSIVLGAFWGFVMYPYVVNPGMFGLAIIGMDRFMLEFFKSFIRKDKSGKFRADKPTNPNWMETREKILMPYILGMMIFLTLLARGV